MAELDGGAPTSDSRQKTPAIKDFGKDFLSSWKSPKVGNSMDFDVETVPRTGKSSFNFEKLDDFDFGGDFKRLSSFKLDMPDLDFSVPSKKAAKTNEKESVLGKQDQKIDKFSFTFDFNELDKFDLDTNLLETEMTSSKCLNDDESHCSDEVLKHNKGLDLKSNLFSDEHLPKIPGIELLPNRQSLPTRTSANISETDGPSYDAITGHGSPHQESVQVVKDQVCLDSVKANTEEEQGNVVPPNSSQSRDSSPIKSSSSMPFPPESRTADCSSTSQNHEADQHEATGGSKTPSEKIQVPDDIAQTSDKEVPQKFIDASCFPFPVSKMPGGTTTSSKANSSREVQEASKMDDNNHLTNSMALKIIKENNSMQNKPLGVIKAADVSEKSLISKLAVSSITDKLPLKRKSFKEPLIDLKVPDTFKHINYSSKGRVFSSSSSKSISPNMASGQSMKGTRKSPIAVQGSSQKDSKKFTPNLTALRMPKINIAISNSSTSIETNTVGETKGKATSKLPITSKADILLNQPPKTKALEVQRAQKPDASNSLEDPSSTNDTPELENMDIEVPIPTESNENIEKAESYSKELDDLCNMLRKKHEEAKELLVRAIVNNNELLMLNHPMVEEKRLAAALQSREYWKV